MCWFQVIIEQSITKQSIKPTISFCTGKSSDDVVLDTVVFLGTCACDEACTMLLCKAEVITSLIELLKAKQEDDEMVLQIVFVFQQILRNESTRDYMIKETGIENCRRTNNC